MVTRGDKLLGLSEPWKRVFSLQVNCWRWVDSGRQMAALLASCRQVDSIERVTGRLLSPQIFLQALLVPARRTVCGV